MKKITLILLIALSINTYAKKDISEKDNRIGFNLGFSANSLKFEGATNQETKNLTKVGGFIGLAFEHKFGRTFALETGLNFVNKGGSLKIKEDLITKGGSIAFNFYSIDVPLIAKIYIGKKKIFNVNVGGYASYSYLTEMASKIDNKVLPDVNEKEKNPKDLEGDKAFNAFDAGINFGLEFVSRKGIGAGLKLNQGLIDATNNSYEESFGALRIPNDKKYALHTGAQLYMIFKF
jgi:hypothetical protein